MDDPQFTSPLRNSAVASGRKVTLTDESGVALVRQFGSDVASGTTHRSGRSLAWSVSPGESTVMNGGVIDGVDLTHVRAVFRLSGAHSQDVLAKICALDLSDDMFPNGAAARTSIAAVATELIRDDIDNTPSYLLLPSRSFGNYVWEVVSDSFELSPLPQNSESDSAD